ncbi:MAG: SurA N-terminal domain-containing protein [Lentisphaeria bacterium]|nr:SurA N-terminal domain-containing protein [Lentisphaeria bacterium]
MIQRMNNVLIKHSKILFGVITIIIIISFVWFFTPGADGSLLFSRNSNVIAKIGNEEVKLSDAERAQKSTMLAQASALYAVYGDKSADFIGRMGRTGEEQLRILATTLKLAELRGFAVSDMEVKEEIKMDPAFRENNKFSAEKYNAFVKILEKAGFSAADYENATRDALLLQKFQMSAFDGVTAPSASEVEADLFPLLFTFSSKVVSADQEAFLKTVKTPAEEDLKKEYEGAKETYMSLPASDAAVYFVNHKDVQVADLEKQVEEMYKAFAANNKKEQSAEEIKKVKENLRNSIVAEEARKLLAAVVKDAGEKPTADALKAAAAKKGVKLQSTTMTGVTIETAPSALADQGLIFSICMIPEINGVSQVVSNKDSAAFAMLTKRSEPEQLTFEAAKKTVADRLTRKQANQKITEALTALRADIISGKVPLDKIDDAAKKLGLTVSAESKNPDNNAVLFHRDFNMVQQLSGQLQKIQTAAQTGDQQSLAELVPAGMDINGYVAMLQNYAFRSMSALGEYHKQKLGYVSPAVSNAFRVITKAEAATVNQDLIKSHEAYLLMRKRDAAFQNWQTWYQKEIMTAIGPYIPQKEQPAPAAE